MLLKRIEIRNIRKIKQADIDFHGPGLQVFQGANESGKSSLAQSLSLTMNGPKSFTAGMISHGEETAEIISYTDDGLKIRTVVSDTVKQTVSRLDQNTNRYAAVSGGVREFLNSICSGLETPWSMREMTDAKIIEMLKERCGVSEKIASVDVELVNKERLRADIGRDRKRFGDAGKAPEQIEHPPAIDDIKSERERTREYGKFYGDVIFAAIEMVRREVALVLSLDDLEKVIPLIQSEIAAARKKLTDNYKDYAEKSIESMKQLNMKLDEQIADWYKIEEKAKAYDAYLEKKDRCDTLDRQYEALTSEIENLREQRKKVLAGMKLGVKGLEIGEDNMLYHNGARRGITETEKSSNWSTAESIQVFFSLGARFAGEMKMLIVDNAESLDAKTTSAISEWAEKSGFLVILLKVAEVPEELEEQIIYLKEGEIVTKRGNKI